MGKQMGASSPNKIKKAPKVSSMGKTKQSEPVGKKGGISGAGLPAPRVSTTRGVKGDER